MKYVIFKYRKVFMPVIIPEHVTHSQIKVTGAKPVSAGFFSSGGGTVTVYGRSESLKLEPGERDPELLQSVVNGYGTMYFLE